MKRKIQEVILAFEVERRYSKDQGIQVIKFWDNEVLNNIEGVLEEIAIKL